MTTALNEKIRRLHPRSIRIVEGVETVICSTCQVPWRCPTRLAVDEEESSWRMADDGRIAHFCDATGIAVCGEVIPRGRVVAGAPHCQNCWKKILP